MFRAIVPMVLIGIAITGFFTITNPLYKDLQALNIQIASYDEALNNSKQLESERDKLTQKYNSIDPTNLERLQKLLPDSVDNIRLILEIEKLALPYGMILKDVKYATTNTEAENNLARNNKLANVSAKDYGIWDLEFSTQGTYFNFVNFIKDLENNLRIVDVRSIDFSTEVGAGIITTPSEAYKYNVKIKTYWLKN